MARSTPSNAVDLRIAGVVIRFESGEPNLTLRVGGAAERFLTRRADPDVWVRVSWADLTGQESGRKIFDSGAVWQLYDEDGGYRFRFTTPRLGEIPYKVARFRKDFARGEVLLHRPYFDPAAPIDPMEYPLDELLLVHLLSAGKGVEVHACGLIDDAGRGHLFVGHSGAGKTTMARLWEGKPETRILSDDRIVLRRTAGTIWMFGTPWHGEAGYAAPSATPLSRVHFLGRAEDPARAPEAIPLEPSDAAARLFARCFVPFHCAGAIGAALDVIAQVASTVPAYELVYAPDARVVEFVRAMPE
ncbi:MAG: hypothetical protein JXP34_28515 [Planctomycetes bacterium]|nr:hypothetical protein [Planctomycetota bacterium]